MAENTIERKVTWGSDFKHHLTTNIIGAQVQPDPNPEFPGKAYVRFSDQANFMNEQSLSTTTLMRVTPEAYKRIAKGSSSVSKALRNKLIGQSRYNFIIVSQKMKNEAGKEEDVAVNVHAYPNRNYRESDFAAELRRPLEPEDAFIQLHPNGDIDILAFPAQFSIGLQKFIEELEKLDKVDSQTEIKFPGQEGTVTASVIAMYGSTITLSCVENA